MDRYHNGHLAASGNYKKSQDQTNDTFYLSNCVLQNTKGSTWEKTELYIRHLLQKHKKDGVFVITGGLMIETSERGQTPKVTHQKINNISVPTHLFKIVITEIGNSMEGLAVFIVPNDPNDGSCYEDLGAHEKLKMIEELHGYRFAPKVDKSKLRDLSDHFKAHMSDIVYKMFITEKKVRDATTEEKLDRAYESLGTIEPSDSLKQLYQTRKQDFISKR